MQLNDLILVFVLLLILWAWWLDRGIKQKAFLYAKKYCENADVQLLDDNIQLNGASLKKNEMGEWCIYRQFKFEFTSTGEHRYLGTMELLGSKVSNIELAAFHI
ncbi:hypothetical protein A9Q73_05100 [Bermanella sp. 47_1433_sub80_T6]|nr:hypothetical protein A9Q73_05100 [Bermanella sp. 47_1433_sub80_T6]